jgi:hypothetical protein
VASYMRMVMKLFDVALRKWSPKRYCNKKIRELDNQHKEQLRAAGSLSRIEKQNLQAELNSETWVWIDWMREMEDQELVTKALKMDIYLDQMPPAPPTDSMYDDSSGYYTDTGTGCRLLRDEIRVSLRTKVWERTPAYRKERREIIELYVKMGTLAVTTIIGLLGAITGLVALLKK